MLCICVPPSFALAVACIIQKEICRPQSPSQPAQVLRFYIHKVARLIPLIDR
jgi:hypothetical protein